MGISPPDPNYLGIGVDERQAPHHTGPAAPAFVGIERLRQTTISVGQRIGPHRDVFADVCELFDDCTSEATSVTSVAASAMETHGQVPSLLRLKTLRVYNSGLLPNLSEPAETGLTADRHGHTVLR